MRVAQKEVAAGLSCSTTMPGRQRTAQDISALCAARCGAQPGLRRRQPVTALPSAFRSGRTTQTSVPFCGMHKEESLQRVYTPSQRSPARCAGQSEVHVREGVVALLQVHVSQRDVFTVFPTSISTSAWRHPVYSVHFHLSVPGCGRKRWRRRG